VRLECLGGALYEQNHLRLCHDVGFADPRVMTRACRRMMRHTSLAVVFTFAAVFCQLCEGQVTVTVFTTTPVSAPVPSDFCSFSIEVYNVLPMFTSLGTTRTAFVNLLKHLQSYNSQQRGPNIRVGGNSADTSEFVSDNTTLLSGDTTRATQAQLDALAAAVPLFNGSVVVGLNARQDKPPAFDVAWALAANATLGSYLEAFEMGNEPNYWVYNGIKNNASFNAASYTQQFSAYVTRLVSAGLPQRMFTAPTNGLNPAGSVYNASWAMSFVTAYSSNLVSVCSHYYPLSVCRLNDGSLPSPSPTPALLLSPANEASSLASLPGFIAAAVANGLPFHIGEGSAVCCSGSNVTASGMVAALWTLDTMFKVASMGVSRFNFHGGPTADNAPVRFFITGSNPTTYSVLPSVNAPYYGMAAFTYATANSARLVQTINSSPNGVVSGWAVVDASGTVRIALINKNAATNAPTAIVAVRLPGTATLVPAQVALLLPGPGGLTGTSGLRWMNMTWDGSVDGKPVGQPVTTTLLPTAPGEYDITLAPYSAVILTISANVPTPAPPSPPPPSPPPSPPPPSPPPSPPPPSPPGGNSSASGGARPVVHGVALAVLVLALLLDARPYDS
jgi:hypothetical protein